MDLELRFEPKMAWTQILCSLLFTVKTQLPQMSFQILTPEL